MNLVVDIGNTSVKLALFNNDSLVQQSRVKPNELSLIDQFIDKQKVDKAIVASVADESKEILADLTAKIPLVVKFDSKTPIPIQNLYKTADTLGNDRIPTVVAANQLYPACDILVIDAGTCIKYNFLNQNSEFIGGGISPGINMRFKALNTFTAHLPLVEADFSFNKLVGSNTLESILMGVQTAVINEVEGILNQYKHCYPGIKVLVTGGDFSFFEKRLKNTIFVRPNLLLEGLNLILNYLNYF